MGAIWRHPGSYRLIHRIHPANLTEVIYIVNLIFLSWLVSFRFQFFNHLRSTSRKLRCWCLLTLCWFWVTLKFVHVNLWLINHKLWLKDKIKWKIVCFLNKIHFGFKDFNQLIFLRTFNKQISPLEKSNLMS